MYLNNLTLLFTIMIGCTVEKPNDLPENYHEDLTTWKQDRDERLRADNGWINLAGLFWLDEGDNTFGSGMDNDVIFPAPAPDNIGAITQTDSVLSFTSAHNLEVMVDSAVQSNAIVYDRGNEIQAVMELGRYRWFVIERAGKYGIRLRDLENPYTKQPLEIEYFEWSEKWRVVAKYREFEEVQTIAIDNIIGMSFDEEFTGEYAFEIDGNAYSVWPSIGEASSFIMFADATSGDESYGGGRYLSAGVPVENGELIIDFNKAVNPPCGFSDFATCPLPPLQNILEIPVLAGEKAYHFEH